MSEEASVVGKVFTGFYLALYTWFVLYTLVYFWDILIPWNIGWWDYFYFNSAFIVTILLGIVMVVSLWVIWSIPSMSKSGSTRWMFNIFPKLILSTFLYSNMAGEPMPIIGSSWTGADLRYPEFMSDPNFKFNYLIFTFVMELGIKSELSNSATYMFRPYWPREDHLKLVKENLSGILACLYIYASYLYILLAVTQSWTEKFVLFLILISFCHSCFGNELHFYNLKKAFFLIFIPIYALIRAYFSYYEWTKLGSIWVFLLKLCYCLSQILIFVGWYSDPKSILSQWLCPFIKNELEFELKLKSEIEDENNQDQLEGENDAREKDQIEEKIDSGAGIKEE